MIQSSASEICAAFLCGAGLSIGRPTASPLPTWPVTAGALPVDVPPRSAVKGDAWVAVRDLVPLTEGKYQRTGETVTKPKVQILVRHKDYAAADLQARKIAFALSPVLRQVVVTLTAEQVLFEACKIEQPPAFLYEEEKNRRQVFVLVAQLTVSEV